MKRGLLSGFLLGIWALHMNLALGGDFGQRGGIVYYIQQGILCPGYVLAHPATNRFEIREAPPEGCPLIFPPPEGLFTFILGALPPGQVIVAVPDGIDPDFFFTYTYEVPASNEQPISAIQVDPSGHLTFHINGIDSVDYIVQRSSDFIAWTDVTTLTGAADFTETEAFGVPVFYRLKIPNVQALPLQ